MKSNERREVENEIKILKYERDELHKNYLNARNDAVAEVLNILLDEPYCIYIAEEIVYEIATKIYNLKVENGRIKVCSLRIGDTVVHESGFKGVIIEQADGETKIRCTNGRLYEAPTEEFRKARQGD